MISYSYFGGKFGGGLRLQLEATQINQDVLNNTSTVNVVVKLISTYAYPSGANPRYGNLTVNGAKETLTLNPFSIKAGETKVLSNKNYVIPHNADGNKALDVKADFTINLIPAGESTYSYTSASTSLSLPLTWIPRADVITGNNTTLPTSVTFNIKKNGLATAYKLDLEYGGVKIAKDILTSDTFVSLTEAEWLQVCNANKTVKSFALKLTLHTYKDTTLIGSTSSTITVTIPTEAPTLPAITQGSHIKENNATVKAIVGSNTIFLKTISSMGLIVPTATTKWGATINAREIIVKKGTTVIYTGTDSTANISFNDYGAMTAYMRVKDSRGNWSNQVSQAITVLNYNKPAISRFTNTRINADGSKNIIGTSAQSIVSASVSSVLVGGIEKNQLTYKIDEGANNKVPNTVIVGLSVANVSHIHGTYAIGSSFVVTLTVTDKFGSTSTAQYTISIAEVPFTWAKKGMGIGGVYNPADTKGVALQVFNTAHFIKPVYFDTDVYFATIKPVTITATGAISGASANIPTITATSVTATGTVSCKNLTATTINNKSVAYFETLTQTAYDALATKDPNTLYIITG